MSRLRVKQWAILFALVVFGAGLVMLLGSRCVKPRLQIRGQLSKEDLGGILHAHRTSCPERLPGKYWRWLPASIQKYISSQLNPIEIISVPTDGHAIIVYRGFDHYYYDEKGKHRWGTATYYLNKKGNSWVSSTTTFPAMSGSSFGPSGILRRPAPALPQSSP